MIHTLKIKPEFMFEILVGKKTCELRKDDRDFKVGDHIYFVKENGCDFYIEKKEYRITHILRNAEEYGLKEGYCILSFRE